MRPPPQQPAQPCGRPRGAPPCCRLAAPACLCPSAHRTCACHAQLQLWLYQEAREIHSCINLSAFGTISLRNNPVGSRGAQGHSRIAQGAGAVGATSPLGRDVRLAVVARHAPRPPLACRGMAAHLSACNAEFLTLSCLLYTPVWYTSNVDGMCFTSK